VSEHLRSNGYQWVDSQVCMVWDHYHEQPERFHLGCVIGPVEAALEWVEARKGWENRTTILMVNAIVAHKLSGDGGEHRG
jgi:hypothetical protein